MIWKGVFEINGHALTNNIQAQGIETTFDLWAGTGRDRFKYMRLLSGGTELTRQECAFEKKTDHLKSTVTFIGANISSQPDQIQLLSGRDRVLAERALSGEIQAGRSVYVTRRDYLSGNNSG